jgi:hypothetical protein
MAKTKALESLTVQLTFIISCIESEWHKYAEMPQPVDPRGTKKKCSMPSPCHSNYSTEIEQDHCIRPRRVGDDKGLP